MKTCKRGLNLSNTEIMGACTQLGVLYLTGRFNLNISSNTFKKILDDEKICHLGI